MAAQDERRDELLSWYRLDHRDLPWRRTRDPYRIWVSEIMLQQTRVETVLSYYERFLTRFPDVGSLAAAPQDDVLAAWSGLGYYRRARFLKTAAETVVRDHASRFPSSVEGACELPGIGRSTAGAIVSIAYGTRAPVLDGNVKRVLARLAGLDEQDGAALEKRAWPLAQRLVDCDDAGDVNQALMELGATVCLPFAAARCEECPWRRSCRARAEDRVAALPRTRPRTALRDETWAVAVARRASRFLVHRRDPVGLLHDLFELPTFELTAAQASSTLRQRAALAAALRTRFNCPFTVGDELLLHRQVISNRRVTMRVFAVSVGERVAPRGRWLTPTALAQLAITMATRKLVAKLAHPPALNAKAKAAAARPRARSRPRPP